MYRYVAEEINQKFHLLHTGSYMTHCLTQAIHLRLANQLQLCTASTDGHIAFWSTLFSQRDLMSSEQVQNIESSDTALTALTEPKPPEYLSRKRIHQNSIKSMTSIQLSSCEFLIATGGDDCALAFTLLIYPLADKPKAPICSTLLIPSAHAAAITAIGYLGTKNHEHTFVTASNDQILKLWYITIGLGKDGAESMKVIKGPSTPSTIADVSSMDVFGEDRNMRIILAGIGMEIWKIPSLSFGLER